jgi:hypothetical protein
LPPEEEQFFEDKPLSEDERYLEDKQFLTVEQPPIEEQ